MKNKRYTVSYRITCSDYVDVGFDLTEEQYKIIQNGGSPYDTIQYFDEIVHREFDDYGGFELDYILKDLKEEEI